MILVVISVSNSDRQKEREKQQERERGRDRQMHNPLLCVYYMIKMEDRVFPYDDFFYFGLF